MFTSFDGAASGAWAVTSIRTVCGDAVAPIKAITISHSSRLETKSGSWRLTGVASHVRYVERAEKRELVARQAGLGRVASTRAALIPIAKSQAWWDLTQDARREIFEAQSGHIANNMKYLPAIARQLYHCRDLNEPFDFLTWFEFSPSDEDAFDDMLIGLRLSEEWRFVSREVDIRLTLNPTAAA